MTTAISLAEGFPEPDYQAWLNLAQQALKGAPFDRLIGRTYDGIEIKPLYTSADVSGSIGGVPSAQRDLHLPWDIRQTVLNPNPVEANQIALHDLRLGVSSIEFQIDPDGVQGVAAESEADFQALVGGILTDFATVALGGTKLNLAHAQTLLAAIEPQKRAMAKLAFNLNPFGASLDAGAHVTPDEAMGFAKEMQATCPFATVVRADARIVHEAGGSECEELAYLIGAGIALLKAGERTGMSPRGVNSSLVFCLSIGPDAVLEIAKIKAVRHLWAQVMTACGAGDAPMHLQAVTSGRMQTRVDAPTNMLRATCAAFAAGVGGADVVTVLPYSSAYALADEKARRIARNTQLILQEESHLGRVNDPAAGAWAMTALAQDLARVAWAKVQEIEHCGGLERALAAGLVQNWVLATRTKRLADVAEAKTQLVGVNLFPNLGEDLPDYASSNMALAAQAQAIGGGLAPMYLAQDYEALRARRSQTVFLATLGSVARSAARVGYARNVFESGGIKALGGDAGLDDCGAIVAAFRASGARIACLCGDDNHYQQGASTLALALKEAGCAMVWLAGKGQFEGVDRLIHREINVLDELRTAHDLLEQTT